jgi:hypothetical protein
MREITLYELFALESRQQYKRPEFGRTAIHWKNFSSSIERRNPDLLKPR